jgi:hypothetical protein
MFEASSPIITFGGTGASVHAYKKSPTLGSTRVSRRRAVHLIQLPQLTYLSKCTRAYARFQARRRSQDPRLAVKPSTLGFGKRCAAIPRCRRTWAGMKVSFLPSPPAVRCCSSHQTCSQPTKALDATSTTWRRQQSSWLLPRCFSRNCSSAVQYWKNFRIRSLNDDYLGDHGEKISRDLIRGVSMYDSCVVFTDQS